MNSQDLLRNIFLRYARGNHVCWGVEVQRIFPHHTRTEYLVPNTFKAWHDYVDGQPEFLGRPSQSRTYGRENIDWVKDKIEKGEVKVTNYVLYIDAYHLLKEPNHETMRAMNALSLNIEWESCPVVIFNIWEGYYDGYRFSHVPSSLFHWAFGYKLSRRPHNLTVLYNAYERPQCAIDFANVSYEEPWPERNSPFFSTRHNEVQAEILLHRHERADVVHPPEWYAQYTNSWWIFFETYGPWKIEDAIDWTTVSPIAGCYRWHCENHRICAEPRP